MDILVAPPPLLSGYVRSADLTSPYCNIPCLLSIINMHRSPALTIGSVVVGIVSLLDDPNVDPGCAKVILIIILMIPP